MTREAAGTSVDPMAIVALEQRLPPDQRIVCGVLAVSLLPPVTRWVISRMNPGAASAMAALTERRFRGCGAAPLSQALHRREAAGGARRHRGTRESGRGFRYPRVSDAAGYRCARVGRVSR